MGFKDNFYYWLAALFLLTAGAGCAPKALPAWYVNGETNKTSIAQKGASDQESIFSQL